MVEVLNIEQPAATDLQIVAMMKALSDPTRYRIFQCLRSCCATAEFRDSGDIAPTDGPTAGEVCCQVTGSAQITPLISHHLKEMRVAGLITMERRGKNMICSINPAAVEILAKTFASHSSAPAGKSDQCC